VRTFLSAALPGLLLCSGCSSVPRKAMVGPPSLGFSTTIAEPRRAPLRITRVAHASVLLEFDGAALLTDPWFTETAR
jgi:hypothetical protein